MDALNKVKFEARFSHYETEKEWPRYVFNCFINGEKFEYYLGIGHAFKVKVWNSEGPAYLNNGKVKSVSQGDFKKMREEGGEFSDLGDGFKISKPKKEEVIHCILLDLSCASDTFESFCSEMDYDTDSRKALATYLACQENGHKLKKALGPDFQAVKEEIEKLEL